MSALAISEIIYEDTDVCISGKPFDNYLDATEVLTIDGKVIIKAKHGTLKGAFLDGLTFTSGTLGSFIEYGYDEDFCFLDFTSKSGDALQCLYEAIFARCFGELYTVD